MKLVEIVTPKLMEMAAKKICTICGNPMAGYHYWYKGGWKCKKSSLAATTPEVGQSTAPTTTPSPTKPAVNQKAAVPTIVPPKDKLKEWLNKHHITDYTINADGSIDVHDDSVNLDSFRGFRIPVKFNMVAGNFSCAGGNLTTLENCPKIVVGYFDVSHNDLTSLHGFPIRVGGSVDISGNGFLSSLDGIHDLETDGSFYAEQLDSLKSLKGIHKQVKRIDGTISFGNGGVRSHLMGLMMIKGVTKVITPFSDADNIMNKHLETDRDPIAAQDEMIDAGLSALAGA